MGPIADSAVLGSGDTIRNWCLGNPSIINYGVPGTPTTKTITLSGNIPAELWNRLGTRVLPKLRAGKDLKLGIDFSVTVETANATDLQVELKQILTDLRLHDSVELEQT